jgi:hypothetical protein
MALRGYASLYKRNKVLAKCYGGTNFTEPATYYFAIHFAAQLAAGVSSGTNLISVNTAMEIGANLIIAPSYSGTADLNAEQRVVQGISGSGPYTVTLDSNLGFSHAMDVYVAFDPGVDGATSNPHSGDNYARVAIVNNTSNFPAPSGAQTNSGVQATWGTPSAPWGLATHIQSWDAASSGNLWDVFVMQSFLILNTSVPTPSIGVGNLIAKAILPGV